MDPLSKQLVRDLLKSLVANICLLISEWLRLVAQSLDPYGVPYGYDSPMSPSA